MGPRDLLRGPDRSAPCGTPPNAVSFVRASNPRSQMLIQRTVRRTALLRCGLCAAVGFGVWGTACDSRAPAPAKSSVDSVALPTRPGPQSSADSALQPPAGPLMVSPEALQQLHEPEIMREVGGRRHLAPIVPAPLYVVNGVPLPFARALAVVDSIGYSDFSAGSTWPDDFTSPAAQRYWLAHTGYAAYPDAVHGVIEITARPGQKGGLP